MVSTLRAAPAGATARGTGCGTEPDCPMEEVQHWLVTEPEQARAPGPWIHVGPSTRRLSDGDVSQVIKAPISLDATLSDLLTDVGIPLSPLSLSSCAPPSSSILS
ncbi:hypothetical protein DVH24_021098 [Malus domestica]|uniref:Uncharacterized protein n=1 Tax=Malus domestica TaxID=3750 RepID=A0A498JB55_MALDO|nr:hypothetical protein DVH24_021098 [Malus domestica]